MIFRVDAISLLIFYSGWFGSVTLGRRTNARGRLSVGSSSSGTIWIGECLRTDKPSRYI